MIQTPDVPDAMRLPPEPPGRDRRAQLAFGLVLLALVATLLFFTLVVSPSAGAAGGCGGG